MKTFYSQFFGKADDETGVPIKVALGPVLIHAQDGFGWAS